MLCYSFRIYPYTYKLYVVSNFVQKEKFDSVAFCPFQVFLALNDYSCSFKERTWKEDIAHKTPFFLAMQSNFKLFFSQRNFSTYLFSPYFLYVQKPVLYHVFVTVRNAFQSLHVYHLPFQKARASQGHQLHLSPHSLKI